MVTGSIGTERTFCERMMAIMTPYSATASQKMTLIKLSDQIRGTRTAAPIRLAPINRMPLAAERWRGRAVAGHPTQT